MLEKVDEVPIITELRIVKWVRGEVLEKNLNADHVFRHFDKDIMERWVR